MNQERGKPENQKPDPTHVAETSVLVKEAYGELNAFGKAVFIATAVYTVFMSVLPEMLLYRLGVRSNARHFRLKRVTTTSPLVFVGDYYMPHQGSNCIVIKGKDGKLLIRSPPQPLPSVIAQIAQEGEVGAILVTTGHDTYADKWKELFPNAKVLGMKRDIPVLNNRTKVDMALEDASEFLENYHVVQVISESPYLRYEDFTLLIQLEDGNVIASVGCGITYRPVKGWWNPVDWRWLLGGWAGFGYSRVFALIFAKDTGKAREAWAEFAKTPGLTGLLFLHGEPLIGPHVPNLMSKAQFDLPLPVKRS